MCTRDISLDIDIDIDEVRPAAEEPAGRVAPPVDPAVLAHVAELFSGSADEVVAKLLRVRRDACRDGGLSAALAAALEEVFIRGEQGGAVQAALVALLSESPAPITPALLSRYAVAERGAMVVTRRVARTGFGDGAGAVPASFGESVAAAAAAVVAIAAPGWSAAGKPAEQCDPTWLDSAVMLAGVLYNIADDLGHDVSLNAMGARPLIRRAVRAAQRCRLPLARGRAGAASQPAPGAALAVAIAVGDVDSIHDIFGELGIAGALSPASAEAARRAFAGHDSADKGSASALAAWGVSESAIALIEQLNKKIIL